MQKVIPDITLSQYRTVVGTFNMLKSSIGKTCDCSVVKSMNQNKKSFKQARNRTDRKSFKVMTASLLILLMVGHALASVNLSKLISNKEIKSYNGNKNKSIKIVHWNKGNSQLTNKMQEIRNIAACHNPLVIGISEANFNINYDKSQVQISNYELHLCPQAENGLNRIVVYSHKDLIVKPRPDLHSQGFSSIWLECHLPKQKKFLLCNAYREWQVPGMQGSLMVTEQLSRWQVFLSQWEKAIATGLEIIVMGDMNINHLNWQSKSHVQSNQTRKLRSLIEELFIRIIPYGFSQLVKVPTRHFPGQESAGLDHIYTNIPEKYKKSKLSTGEAVTI